MPPVMRAGPQQAPSAPRVVPPSALAFRDKPPPRPAATSALGRVVLLVAVLAVALLGAGNVAAWAGWLGSHAHSHSQQSASASSSSSSTLRHVFHAQPDEAWKISPAAPAAEDGDTEEEQNAPDAAEEKDSGDAASEEIPQGDGHYDQADLTRPEPDEEGDDAALAAAAAGAGTGAAVSDDDVAAEDPVSREVMLAMESAKASGSLSLVPQIPKNKGKTFVYFRSKTCSYLCARAKVLGWKPGIVDLTNHIYPTMLLIRWTAYDRYRFLSRTIVNQVGAGSSCIGGGKGIQLLCRQQLAARHQCEYSDLGLQPRQWNIQKSTQCEDYFLAAAEPDNADKVWIMKPGGSFHGRGITMHRGDDAQIRAKYGSCKKKLPEGLIIQEYIMKPALMSGHKFDLRSYLLIASTAPFLAFYHDGFARRSEHPFSMAGQNLTDVKAHITNDVSQSSENHFFGFEQLEASLHKEFNFPADYMESVFRPRAMRITNYLFHTAVDRTGHKIEARPGRWQFFALDWMIDEEGKTHLLEANGDPTVKDYPGTNLTPRLWDSMFELVEMIHLRPEDLAKDAVLSVRQRFAYKGWRLVYNQLEAATDPYNPCKFKDYARDKHPLYGFEPAGAGGK